MKWFNLGDEINLFALIAAIGILTLTAFVVNLYTKQMKSKTPKGKLSGEMWDGIGKFENHIPFGWGLCFVFIIIWGIWYIFVGYPLNSFSQIGQYNQEVAQYNKKYEEKWKNLNQNQLVEMGESMFLVQCSQCHGITADGMGGKAQNLTMWGKEEGIMNTIKMGSKGLLGADSEMPPVEMNEDDARAVASYIMADISTLKHTKYPADVAKGKEVFNNAGCNACHGDDGAGMDGVAANLTEYGTPKFLALVLKNGKKGLIGRMPSFAHANLNEVQVDALSAYIESLEPQN